MRKRTQLFEPFGPRAASQLVDDQCADAFPSFSSVHRKRAHFGDMRAERCELRAAEDAPSTGGDDKSRRVERQLADRARQKMALFTMSGNEAVQRPRFGLPGRPDSHATSWRHFCAPTAANAAS